MQKRERESARVVTKMPWRMGVCPGLFSVAERSIGAIGE